MGQEELSDCPESDAAGAGDVGLSAESLSEGVGWFGEAGAPAMVFPWGFGAGWSGLRSLCPEGGGEEVGG